MFVLKLCVYVCVHVDLCMYTCGKCLPWLLFSLFVGTLNLDFFNLDSLINNSKGSSAFTPYPILG